jgi:hypothetical protein
MLSQLSFSTEIPTEEADKQPYNFFQGGLFCLSFDNEDYFYDAMEHCDGYDENGHCIDDDHLDHTLYGLRGGAQHPDDGTGVPNFCTSSGSSTSTSSSSTIAERGSDIGIVNGHHHHDANNDNDNDNKNMPSHSYTQEELVYQQSQDVLKPHPPSPPPLLQDHHELRQQEQLAPPHNPFSRLLSPAPPLELPERFLRAGKGDPEEGWRRYEATLQWRKENGIDTILVEPHLDFELIKSHYPHYYHLRGLNGEPVFFEQPPKTNLQAMRKGGVKLQGLLNHYAMVTEFQWQYIERDDFARSITVVDLEGMRIMDFVGECVEYVKSCSDFTGQHFPERAGFVLVINVPGWFQMIWNVVKPMVDEVTLRKINILRGKEAILEALLEKIPIENIPPEYGGQSVPLGESPQEYLLRDLVKHNNNLAAGDHSCGGRAANPPCPFCSFVSARSY